VQQGFELGDSVVSIFGAVGSIAISAHESHGAEEICDTIAQYLVHSGKLGNNYCVIILPPECCRYFVGDGWTKRDIQQGIFERTTRDVAWAKRNGWAKPGSPIEPRGGEVLPGDEDTPVAIAGRPEEIYLTVAGGPAGAFIHAILPYAGKLVSQKITPAY